MITIIKKLARLRRFAVWDLEWVPGTYQLRVCGVFEPDGGYRFYKTIEEFVGHEIIPSNKGLWFYAHFGGMADLQFLIEFFSTRPEFRIRGSFSGASCVIFHVVHGRCSWHFVDSFWLLRSSLREIAKWIGQEKTGPTDNMTEEERRDWYANVDFDTLRKYNENDCRVLWDAIHAAQLAILELGGQLQMTLASTGMQLFRRKYLMDDVETNGMLNKVAKQSYFASRVEVFQMNVEEQALYFDVNSSFPYAMTHMLPGRLRQCYREIPDKVWNDYPFLADVLVDVPDLYLPPLPLRWRHKVLFPVGRWRGWFTGTDLKLLIREGGRMLKVYQCQVFEPFWDLKAYATDLYNKRANTTDKFEREFYKLLLNSLYGKFAEQPQKTTLLMNPSAEQIEKLERESMVMPGVFIRKSEVPIPHAHVPISSYVTSIARQTLFDYLLQSQDIHYCDTDGFSTTDSFPVGPGLGKLKLEKSFYKATFLAPKLYRWYPEGKPPVVKAKGFSLKKETADAQFDALMAGDEIEVIRMVRIRENLRDSILRPRDKTIGKQLRQLGFLKGDYKIESIPKRFVYPDGQTRAWSVGELEEGVCHKRVGLDRPKKD